MTEKREIIVIGGGAIGLAIAIELRLRGASVTVLSRNSGEAAAFVAAGMIAPQAEQISPSAMLELCLRSRALYPDWTGKLEEISGLETGYWPCGILAPVYEMPSVTSVEDKQTGLEWRDCSSIHQFQPGLSDEVVGGWWYPQDAQVDNRRALIQCLQVAARELGVDLCEGVAVRAIANDRQQVTHLTTNKGEIRGQHYILATGAWSGQLLPLPVYPKKGQMLSVRVPPSDSKLPLNHVLFGEEVYIVPRRDGLMVIGATSENVGFIPEVTAQGIHRLLSDAIRLFPAIKDFSVEEFWWGYRPETPDELPILGESWLSNLTLATGHYRNGILLAPITAALLADLVLTGKSDPLLAHFRYNRFKP
jgi:glycine oxidase